MTTPELQLRSEAEQCEQLLYTCGEQCVSCMSCERRRCLKCCARMDRGKRNGHGCSVASQGDPSRDPDTAQLLGNETFYGSQSTDSNRSSPVHKCNGSKKPSHTKSYKFFHNQVCDKKGGDHLQRRSVSCNDLDELIRGNQELTESVQTEHSSVLLMGCDAPRVKLPS